MKGNKKPAAKGKASAEASAKGARSHASKATKAQRVHDVLRIRLDGAEAWDILQYIAEKQAAGEAPWTVEEGTAPLKERQIRNYVRAADRAIAESCWQQTKKLFRIHLAQRRNLYARAVQAGDIRTALSVLMDLATLQDLYPAKKVNLGAAKGAAVKILIAEGGFDPNSA
jgi:hypothetical protein